MTQNLITQERLKSLLMYNADTGDFLWRVSRGRVKAGSKAGSTNGTDYVQLRLDGYNYKAHRLAWLYVYGEWPPAEIDHINRVRCDNRISNLRSVTRAQNHQNRNKPKHNTSGYVGVSFHRRSGCWRADIKINGKQRALGLYDTKQEAVQARRAAELNTHPYRTAYADAHL